MFQDRGRRAGSTTPGAVKLALDRRLGVMPEDWHHFRYPGSEIGQPVLSPADIEAFGLDRWRELPRAQTPPWPDQAAVDEVGTVLNTVPPIVAPYEVDQLRDRLAMVAEGKAF